MSEIEALRDEIAALRREVEQLRGLVVYRQGAPITPSPVFPLNGIPAYPGGPWPTTCRTTIAAGGGVDRGAI